MNSIDSIRHLALSLPETTEEPHFEKTSFRVKGKIFMTANAPENRITVRLSPADQDVFSQAEGIYPVPNKWGNHGWTHGEFPTLHPDLLRDLIFTAYYTTAPAKLGEQMAKTNHWEK